MAGTSSRGPLPTATVRETVGVLADVLLPTVAEGVIIRRPRAVALAETLELDRRAVRLRESAGLGPDRPLPGTLDHFALRFSIEA